MGFEAETMFAEAVSVTIDILPIAQQSELRVTHATRTSPEFGKQLTSYMAHVVVTEAGPTFQLDEDKFRRTNSPYTGVPKLDLRPEFKGIAAADVAEVTGYPPVSTDGHYLGLWQVGGQSVVGIFQIDNGKVGPVTPLFTSDKKIDSVDFWSVIHGPYGVISIMRHEADGSAELIDISIRIEDFAAEY